MARRNSAPATDARARGPRWSRRRSSSGGPSPERKVLLHVGCGPPNPEAIPPRYRGPEWQELRLDVDPRVKPDIVGSIVDMSGVKSSSVDAIWSSHNLEHIYSHEVPVVLRGFLRVLRPGGEVLLTMPDLEAVAELVLAGKLTERAYGPPNHPVTALDMLYGDRAAIQHGNDYMAHHTGFTAETLFKHLEQAGFVEVDVKRGDPYALWAVAQKPE